jgi:hypothetical protein
MEQNYSESKVEKKIKWFWITFGILIFSIIIFFSVDS